MFYEELNRKHERYHKTGVYIVKYFLNFFKGWADFFPSTIRSIRIDYLKAKRRHYVNYNNTTSSYEKVTCGIPQGSILGPLLFILYMNDICNTSKLLSFILFADDTTVFLSDKDVNVLHDTMNNELYEVCKWFKCNKLSLNASKTNLMLLGTAYKTKNANVSHSIYLDDMLQLPHIDMTYLWFVS